MALKSMKTAELSRMSAVKLAEELVEGDVIIYNRNTPVYAVMSLDKYISITGEVPEGHKVKEDTKQGADNETHDSHDVTENSGEQPKDDGAMSSGESAESQAKHPSADAVEPFLDLEREASFLDDPDF